MLTVICGANSYECHQRLMSLIKDDLSVIDIDMTEQDSLVKLKESVVGATLFAGSDTVLVRELKEVKSVQAEVAEIAADTPDSTELIIYLPTVKANSPPAKALLKLANQKFIEELPDRRQLNDWVLQTTADLKGEITSSVANKLIDWVGEDQQLLKNEIAKLVSYQDEITQKSVELLAVASPTTTVFQMLEAMLHGNSKSAIKYYHDLLDQQLDPYYVMSMICWQASAMTIVVKGRKFSNDQLASASGVSSYVLSKASSATRNLNTSATVNINSLILDLDYKMKTTSVDVVRSVENLIRTIAVRQTTS